MARTPGAKDKQPRKIRKDNQVPKGIIADQTPDLVVGYNTRRIAFMQAILPTEPLDPNDVAEMERRFMRYLDLCAEWDMKIGNQAAYAAIGIDKGIAWEWENRSTGNPARADFIKKVRQFCAMYREGLMEDGKVNPVTGIFWQKNYDGLRDQQEVVLTPNTSPLGEQQDAETLKKKYLEQTYGISGELAESEVLELPESAESPQKEAETAQNGAESKED